MPRRAATPAAEGVTEREALGRAALADVTPTAHVGAFIGEERDGDVITLRYATTQSGYPGWEWTVGMAALPDSEPTVLEMELLPGDGALLAPDWVPWSERLEEWRAAQVAAGADADDDDLDVDDDDDDVDDDLDDDLADVLDLVDDLDEVLDPEEVALDVTASAANAEAMDEDGDQEDDSDSEAGEGDGERTGPRRRQRRRRRGKNSGGNSPDA